MIGTKQKKQPSDKNKRTKAYQTFVKVLWKEKGAKGIVMSLQKASLCLYKRHTNEE